MRRKDREMPADFALTVTDRCAFAVMATVNPDGTPYCIPLSLARDGEWLYFHCAHEGQKIDNLRHRNKVCISCVEDVKVIPGDFSTEYESAIISGTATEVTGKEEKIHALELISRRYDPGGMANFDAMVRRSLDVTTIWKIHIDAISGKRKKLDKDGKEMKFGRME